MASLGNPWVQREKVEKEGLGALRIFLRGGSQIKIVHSFFGLRCGLAEEHFIVYNFRLMKDSSSNRATLLSS